MNVKMANPLDLEKLFTMASLRESPSFSYTMDIVLIIASFDRRPVINETDDFQSANPENLKIGDIKFPNEAKILLELSSMNCNDMLNDCANQITIDELNIITPTCSKKSLH